MATRSVKSRKASGASLQDGEAHGRKRVLLVEDHTPAAEMTQILLEDNGFSVTWAKSTEAAFDLLSAFPRLPGPPDLILLDLTMPGLNPVEMLKRLGVHHLPPVILLSSLDEDATRRAARQSGAAGYVLKPFNLEGLLHEVRRVLEPPH